MKVHNPASSEKTVCEVSSTSSNKEVRVLAFLEFFSYSWLYSAMEFFLFSRDCTVIEWKRSGMLVSRYSSAFHQKYFVFCIQIFAKVASDIFFLAIRNVRVSSSVICASYKLSHTHAYINRPELPLTHFYTLSNYCTFLLLYTNTGWWYS